MNEPADEPIPAHLFVYDEEKDAWNRLREEQIGSHALLPRLAAFHVGKWHVEPLGSGNLLAAAINAMQSWAGDSRRRQQLVRFLGRAMEDCETRDAMERRGWTISDVVYVSEDDFSEHADEQSFRRFVSSRLGAVGDQLMMAWRRRYPDG